MSEILFLEKCIGLECNFAFFYCVYSLTKNVTVKACLENLVRNVSKEEKKFETEILIQPFVNKS